MRNNNIPSGRGIILSGNRQKAGTYIGIAKRKMHDMKQMMSIGRLPMMQRRFMLDRDCVWLHLLSIDGADFIRIHSCAEDVDCKVSFTFEATGLSVVFTSKASDNIDNGFWDFGDGQFEANGSNITHVYENPGTYNVTLYGFETDNVNLESDKSLSHVTERRQSAVSIVSSAEAYSFFTAAPWINNLSIDNNYYRSLHVTLLGQDRWTYEAGRVITTVPLDLIAGNTAVLENRAFIWIFNIANKWTNIEIGSPAPKMLTVTGSDLDIDTYNTAEGAIAGIVDPTIPMVSSSFTMDDISETDPYGSLADPNPFGENFVGWENVNPSNRGSLSMIPYKCISTKTRAITVV